MGRSGVARWHRSRPSHAPRRRLREVATQEFILEGRQGRVVELELPLEGALGQAPPALQHGYRLVEDLLKGHRRPLRVRDNTQRTMWGWDMPPGHICTANERQRKAGIREHVTQR